MAKVPPSRIVEIEERSHACALRIAHDEIVGSVGITVAMNAAQPVGSQQVKVQLSAKQLEFRPPICAHCRGAQQALGRSQEKEIGIGDDPEVGVADFVALSRPLPRALPQASAPGNTQSGWMLAALMTLAHLARSDLMSAA